MMSNAIQEIRYRPVERVGQVAGAIGSKTDTFGRTLKAIIPALETIEILSQHFCHHELAWCRPLIGCFLVTKDVLNATCFIDRINEWTSGGPPWTHCKRISRLCLTAAHFIEPANFLDKTVFHWTVRRVYDIAILSFVKNIFYMISAFFSFLNGYKRTETGEEISATKKELVNWQNDRIVDAHEEAECLRKLNAIFQKKFIPQLQASDHNRIRAISLGSGLAELKGEGIEKVKQLANYILALQSADKGMRQKLKDYKIVYCKAKLDNLNKIWWKGTFSLGADIGKFFGIAFFTGLKAYAPIYSCLKDPTIDLALSVFSFCGYSSSLGKNLCDDNVIKPIKISPFVCP